MLTHDHPSENAYLNIFFGQSNCLAVCAIG